MFGWPSGTVSNVRPKLVQDEIDEYLKDRTRETLTLYSRNRGKTARYPGQSGTSG